MLFSSTHRFTGNLNAFDSNFSKKNLQPLRLQIFNMFYFKQISNLFYSKITYLFRRLIMYKPDLDIESIFFPSNV